MITGLFLLLLAAIPFSLWVRREMRQEEEQRTVCPPGEALADEVHHLIKFGDYIGAANAYAVYVTSGSPNRRGVTAATVAAVVRANPLRSWPQELVPTVQNLLQDYPDELGMFNEHHQPARGVRNRLSRLRS